MTLTNSRFGQLTERMSTYREAVLDKNRISMLSELFW